MERRDLEHNARFLQKYNLNVSKDELARASKLSHHSSSSLMEGMIMTEVLSSGMTFHMVEAKAVRDFSFDAECGPNFKIALLFSGDMRFQFGEQKKFIEDGRRVAKVINFNEVDLCSANAKAEENRSAIYLSVEPDWFEKNNMESTEVKKALTQHLDFNEWVLPEMFWQQAKKIQTQHDDSYISQMSREGFALSLMSSWLEATKDQGHLTVRPDSRRVNQFKELLSSDDVLTMTLVHIGNQLGMSSATLQRYAREHLQMSITQYIRKRRLDLAKSALHRDGVSIMEAALLAGYNHSSNFTTAFKRQFGVPPAAAHHLPTSLR
ncbi:AraC family transcriptional regulator [Marinomonas sp.]|nr:AraC family transcriptional regulator [Marinomonas sp.]MDB4837991.1 AraC family transcriptional regulator [Marinomonas sp.]